MTTVLRYARLLLRAFGWKGLVRRATYLAWLRSGWLRRQLPAAPDFSSAPALDWHHWFDLEAIRERYVEEGLDHLVRARVVAEAERVLSGEIQLYGDQWHDVGWPPRWHANAFTGYEYPRIHWTEIPDDDPDRGDIKDVWELSRLPFTFLLARAHVLTGDDRYVEAWWEAIEDWATHNPPNLGVNWRCGQETSLRGIVLCFGLSAFAEHPATTPARQDLVARVLGASAARVRHTIGYALSQRNNHAVSELAFLLSVGWQRERRLLQLLREVLGDQFYPDGSYSQQSFTYQRLAVQALQWLLATRPDLPAGMRNHIVDVLARSRDFLVRCSDPVSGWLPNYGPNDGGLLFHLDTAHYRNFQPLLAMLGAPADPVHREPTAWLVLPEVATHTTDADRRPTTYHTLRGARSLAFTRIGTGHHRLGHGDQQALDLWVDGHNVVVDPGTYRYTAHAPWRNALIEPAVHSTPRTHDEAPLALGRFLTEGTSRAELVANSHSDEFETLVSRRPVPGGWLWRAMLRHGDTYAVADAADGVDGVLRWNLRRTEMVAVSWPPSTRVDLGPSQDADPASGWTSSLYGRREPIAAFECPLKAGIVLVTQLAPHGTKPFSAGELRRALEPAVPSWITQQLTLAEATTGAQVEEA